MPDTKVQIEYTQDELLKEALWETEMLRRGRDSYLAQLEGANLADTDIGMSLSMQMIPIVKDEIERMQVNYTETLIHGSSRDKNGAAHLIPMCDASLLAVSVVHKYLRAMMEPESLGEVSVRSLLDSMEEAYIEAMSLQMWEQDEEEDYALFWRINGDKLNSVGSNKSQQNRIKKRLKERLSSYYKEFKEQHDTTQLMQLSVATALLGAVGYTKVRMTTEENAMNILSDEGPGSVTVIDGQFCYKQLEVGPFANMFVLRSGTDGNKEVRTMHLSESAGDQLDYSVERRAIGATSLRPMLVKPKRWILTTS